ncbi:MULTISPECIES: DoxX family protein [unclassified Methylophaga]|uniref:DoxX family protein n=1 Tax=unclassified Methylophaga TaxID=2629249 RepID=UPI0025ED3BB3|nr:MULTISPECIES: DoxX family protein [unclassified Methylophaga]|tara:strand:+ start:41524 stop:41886 length:363 start_codon:yes stop_codon:yes gene_type:complete
MMNFFTKYGFVILAAIFFLSGAAKLAGLAFEIQAFERWGYPLWFMYLTGFIEVSGAVVLLIKPVRALAAAGLSLFMIGPVVTHVLHAEWGMMMVALAIMLLAGWIAWQWRESVSLSFLIK